MEAVERPLHVRVAEALGWKVEYREPPKPTECGSCGNVTYDGSFRFTGWQGWPPGDENPLDDDPSIPRYDTDWAATGALIERLRIDVEWHEVINKWYAAVHDDGGWGETPLIAVCNLILALKDAGKL